MTEQNDSAAVNDSYTAELKGPDPEVWGEDSDRPQAATGDTGLGIGEIRNEGTPEEVKGPGSAWEQDEDGNYINR